jgi:hypothetical protein
MLLLKDKGSSVFQFKKEHCVLRRYRKQRKKKTKKVIISFQLSKCKQCCHSFYFLHGIWSLKILRLLIE